MHQYRHVLSRMRLGDTDRAIARSGLMGRKKSSLCRQLALEHGWLDPETSLPESTDLILFLALGGKAGKASGGEENRR